MLGRVRRVSSGVQGCGLGWGLRVGSHQQEGHGRELVRTTHLGSFYREKREQRTDGRGQEGEHL